MNGALDLLSHCRQCADSCCYRGTPLIHPSERDRIVKIAPDYFSPLGRSFIIPKKDGACPYLRAGLCSVQEEKPVDCRIYPLDPFYSGGFVDFAFDDLCPAVLSPTFMAHAVFLGSRWITSFERKEFEQYWSVHKSGNARQSLRRLAERLSACSQEYLTSVRSKLQELISAEGEESTKEWCAAIPLVSDLSPLLSADE